MAGTYRRVFVEEYFSAVETSLPDKTTPATMAMMTAAKDPIQNDFMVSPLPNSVPGQTGTKAL